MFDPPKRLLLQPWILGKHVSFGWSPKGDWVGQDTFKARLMSDAEKPAEADNDSIRAVVGYLMKQRSIGPNSATAKEMKKLRKAAPPPPPAPKPTPASGTPKAKASKRKEAKASKPPPAPKGPRQPQVPGPAKNNPKAQSQQGGFSSTANGNFRSFTQSASWNTSIPQSQDSVDTDFGFDKAIFERYDSWGGVPINVDMKPRQVERRSGLRSNQSWGSVPADTTNTQKVDAKTQPEVEIDWESEQVPTLDDQRDLLGLNDSDHGAVDGTKFGDKEIRDAVIFGAPMLSDEDSEHTKELIPQYGLLGSILQTKVDDSRIFVNTNNPASFFICGLQGSGKSHTLSTLLENYLIPSPKIGVLRKPLSGLVLHFGEFNSRDAFRPCEAAFLASPDRSFAGGRSVRGVTVLVSPSNYLNLKSSYCQIPGVTVRPLKLRSRDLTIQSMLTLMSVDSTSNPPLYMAQVTKVLRDMAALGGEFDYITFTSRLDNVDLIPGQRRMLDQRLELLESFLDLESFDGGCFEDIDSGQQLVIVDLSCPFVDASAACVLFNICIGLFLSATKAEKLGKVIAVDEAHKYMTDTPASKILTEQLLSIIRQQRHYAARIIIATQEPTISPRLMDLASATIIHRFNSPEWFNILRKHLSIASSGGKEATELFSKIVSLRLGEALVFAPSAILTIPSVETTSEASGDTATGVSDDSDIWQGEVRKGPGDSIMKKMDSGFFKMKVRRRITADGGATIRSL